MYVLDYAGTLLGLCGWTLKFFGDRNAFVRSLLHKCLVRKYGNTDLHFGL